LYPKIFGTIQNTKLLQIYFVSPMEQEGQTNAKQLTSSERKALFNFLEGQHKGKKKFPNGVVPNAAKKFGVTVRTVQRIWEARNKKQISLSPQTHTRGRKRKDIDVALVQAIPLDQRSTQRALAYQLGVSKSLIQRNIARGSFVVAASSVKPLIRKKNVFRRIRWALSNIHNVDGTFKFNNFYSHIHIDEKWFYIIKIKKKYILIPGENIPHRYVQSKNFITKVMFLAAVARPRRNAETGNWDFDGKIGIYPFVKQEAAKRNSVNRPRGALVTKSIPVNKETYLEYLRDELLPDIILKFPDLEVPIIVQQDNAGPHVEENQEDFVNDAAVNGITISLRCQPPNSPDFNVLDLGFFNSIQSLQQQKSANSVEELIHNVKQAFEEVSADALEKVWITLMGCMEESLWVNGGNDYVIPHMKKDAALKAGHLPESVEVSPNLVALAEEFSLAEFEEEEEENEQSSEEEDA
jgi:hypothetical protein